MKWLSQRIFDNMKYNLISSNKILKEIVKYLTG